jgi:hypothetical protein
MQSLTKYEHTLFMHRLKYTHKYPHNFIAYTIWCVADTDLHHFSEAPSEKIWKDPTGAGYEGRLCTMHRGKLTGQTLFLKKTVSNKKHRIQNWEG